MEGWIKLYRGLMSHWIWQEDKYLRWWLTILLTVNHTHSKFPVGCKLHDCNPGQSYRKVESWAQMFGCSKKTVVKFFQMLKTDGMIDTETLGKGNRRKHLLTVTNWPKHQHMETETSHERKLNTTPKENRTGNPNVPPNKNDKEGIKNEKNSLFRQRFFSVLEIFYFKNFKNPIAVTNAFFNHYEGVGWKNASGLDIENVESVAENWENKTTEGINCPDNLLAKWKVMFGILKNNIDHYNKFLLIRPAKLENKTLLIRGKQKDIAAIEADKELLQVWRNALFMTFGKLTIQYELDKQIIA